MIPYLHLWKQYASIADKFGNFTSPIVETHL